MIKSLETKDDQFKQFFLDQLRLELGEIWWAMPIQKTNLIISDKYDDCDRDNSESIRVYITLRNPHTGFADLTFTSEVKIDVMHLVSAKNSKDIIFHAIQNLAKKMSVYVREAFEETRRIETRRIETRMDSSGVIKMGDPSEQWKKIMAEVIGPNSPHQQRRPIKKPAITPKPEDTRAENFGAW